MELKCVKWQSNTNDVINDARVSNVNLENDAISSCKSSGLDFILKN